MLFIMVFTTALVAGKPSLKTAQKINPNLTETQYKELVTEINACVISGASFVEALWEVAMKESTLNPSAIGKDSEKGIFQIRQKTWGDVKDDIGWQADLACKIMYTNYVELKKAIGKDSYDNGLDQMDPTYVKNLLIKAWNKGVNFVIKELDKEGI
jgi:hypothetical protein